MSLGTSKDLLKKRLGIQGLNKFPREGQTDMRNIPAMNMKRSNSSYNSDENQHAEDRAKAPSLVKKAIKESLGKHVAPTLPKKKGGKVSSPKKHVNW